MRVVSAETIREILTYDLAISAVREVMIAVAEGTTLQCLRTILPLAEPSLFGVMPGALGHRDVFGAKLISVSPDNAKVGRPSHQGVIVLFDGETGAPSCVLDATDITAIRTAAASAVATDVLARPDAHSLAILGAGEQARTHALAMLKARPFQSLRLWARDPGRSAALAEELSEVIDCEIMTSATVRDATLEADVICTVTGAYDPILESAWVKDGAHVNVVGSSYAGPAEIDNALVARGYFVADSRPGALAQGGEFLRAKAAGLVDDHHVAAEIGEVLSGAKPGRTDSRQVTIYKSLGHIAQDLASARVVLRELDRQDGGRRTT